MSAIETTFTPLTSLGGGVLIGVAAVLLMGLLGRVMGATGIVSGLLRPTDTSDAVWRLALLAGMISGPLAVKLATGAMPMIDVPVSLPMLALSGFIVGLGVIFGSGCTSGHGVCGMARLSPRSIVATITFMLTTGVTVFVLRHGMGG